MRAVSHTRPRERRAAARPPASPPRTGRRSPGSKADRGGVWRAALPPRNGTPRPGARPRRTKAATWPAAVDKEARGALGAGLVPGGCRLGTLFEAKDVEGSERAEVMAGSKVGSAKCAARERRRPRHVSPKRLVSPDPSARPLSRRRGEHPGGPPSLPARMPPRGSSPRSPAGRPVDRPASDEPR